MSWWRIGLVAWLAAVVLAMEPAMEPVAGAAMAGSTFVLEGTYLRNRVCTGNDKDVDALRVRITREEIVYRGGICSIDDRLTTESTVTMRVSCRFDSGVELSSNISFTRRDDDTIDMAQKDGSYNAILRRCPIP